MTTGHTSAEQVFHEARAIESPIERDGYLRGACGNDVALRAKVEALLAADADAGSFLASAGNEGDATVVAAPQEQAGAMIGRYKLLQPIGEGGFGVVWMAEQKKPVKRRVALKIIKLGMDTKQVIARFEAERQALAMMEHPNIATVLDAGATETGRPYFVMALVKGVPITEYCDQNNLTVHERLDLFKLVCSAVQHAHQKGIIHRDIKPSNVLVTLHDGQPVPKVIDFGIAKATNAELTEKTLFTEHRQMVGTPQYMSPEQAEMSGLDIDTRSDIYALGVLLYELLTGTTPFDPKRLREAGLNEIQRIIREEEPHKPSTRLSTLDTLPSIAAHRGIEPRKLGMQIRGDLDWIIMKALEKDRTRRYETANGFADDVQRHLDDEPVVAGPPSAGYRLRKFVRRNRSSVIAAAIFAVVLLAATAVSIGFAASEARQRRVAQAAEIEQSRQRQNALDAQAEAETQRNVALRQSYVANIVAAQASMQANETRTARVRLEQAPSELRGWEWKFLHARLDQSLAVLRGHEGGVRSVAFSPDGSRIASGGNDKTVRLWDATSGEELAVIRGHESFVRSVALSPDGSRIASVSVNGPVRLWDATSGEALALLQGSSEVRVNEVAFSPDGLRIATASADNTVRLWEATTGQELAVLRGHKAGVPGGVRSVAFSPDGSRIASGGTDKTVRLWNATSGEELAVLRGNGNGVNSVAFSPDGSGIASGGYDKTVRVWDATSGEEFAVLRGHEDPVNSVAFSPDGSRIASGSGGGTGSADNTVRLWDATSGEEFAVLRGHEGPVNSVAFSPDGSRIVSGSHDRTVRLWEAASGEELTVLGRKMFFSSVSFSPDGSRLASGAGDGTVRLWEPASGDEIAVMRGHETWVTSVVFSPDGARLASGSRDKTVRLWNASSGEELAVLRGHEEWVQSVAFSPDGSRIASASGRQPGESKDPTVRLWDAASGEELAVLRGHGGHGVFSVAFSPDGSRIVSGGGKTVRLWDAASGEERTVLRGHENTISSVVFSPDGSRIASGSHDQTVRLWNATSGEEFAVLRGHEGGVRSVTFSPDGSRIASASVDNTVRLWDASNGELLAVLRGHTHWVYAIAFSPDGSQIASGALSLRLWDTVAYRDRVRQRDEARRNSETVRPFVDELFSEGLDCSSAATRVQNAKSLREPLRRAALNLVLKRCSEMRQQAADTGRSGGD